jgi:hypothetical protein
MIKTNNDSNNGKTWKDWLIIGLLVFVCIQSLFLAKENRKLRRENRKLHFLLYTPTEVYSSQQKAARMFGIRLKETGTGSEFGLLEGIETDYLLLYVFSTDCFSCDASVELWNEVFRELGESGNVTVRGISRSGLDDVKTFVNRNRAGFPVYRYDCPPDFDVFTSLPQTVLLDKSGQIVFSRSGIPNDSLKNKILEVIIE